MVNTLIFIGMIIGIICVDKAFRPKPIIQVTSHYVPIRILDDGTIVCEKKIDTWG